MRPVRIGLLAPTLRIWPLVLAAIVLTVVPELAREFSEYRMLIFGLVLILMMIWRPQGLLPVRRRHVHIDAGRAPGGHGGTAP